MKLPIHLRFTDSTGSVSDMNLPERTHWRGSGRWRSLRCSCGRSSYVN